MSGRRLATGGALLDRTKRIRFTFEGQELEGFAGDTLASALLANGLSVVGRSFKYHRPRGVFAAGVEEPNALTQLSEGARTDANVPATQIALYQGLRARAVNCWPSAKFDLGAVNNALARFLPAGFYYKTFLWPNWRVYEPLIRRAAGLGKPSDQPDPDQYDARYAHCDVLVVGAGPAGLAAAQAASASGARTLLVEQEPSIGGSLRWRGGEVNGMTGAAWIARSAAQFVSNANVTLLTRTTAIGYFDHNGIVLLESVGGHLEPTSAASQPRQRLWQVRAKQVVLACGAIERPLVFCGNDRPGVMLASAVAQYLGDYGVRCGDEAVFVTNNDSAYASARSFIEAGGRIAAFVDTRPEIRSIAHELLRDGVKVVTGGSIVSTSGATALKRVRVRSEDGAVEDVSADLLAVSGGWSPSVHLHCQSGGKVKWNDRFACLNPSVSVQQEVSVGGCAGVFTLSEALGHGALAGAEAARAAGFAFEPPSAPTATSTISFELEPVWRMDGDGKAFVDFQNDVTVADIALAERENFVSVEHLKRYTTLGMGTDQGKTSNVNALGLMSELRSLSESQSGVTRYRFPYAPVALGAFGGLNRGPIFRPQRRLGLHERHAAHGAVFEEYGSWLRPAYYLRAGETSHQAEQREALCVRSAVGIFDGSPLGKIEIIGPDAALFLDRIYANRMADLAVGRCRYGLMLNELGVIIDDGVCARLGEQHFLVGTTSAGAGRIAAWLEEWLQCEWTKLDVIVAPVTLNYGVVTLTGPKARDVLAKVGVDFPIDRSSFPHLSCHAGNVGEAPARVSRVSYTGEVSYEINASPSHLRALWDKCLEAGQELGITPIGIDAWMLLRMERGFMHIGADTDGTTTPLDVGWGRVLKRKGDFIGRRSLTRPADQNVERMNFVGIEPLASDAVLDVGLPVVSKSGVNKLDGYVTSAGFSPVLRRSVALGMVARGRARTGEEIELIGPKGPIAARITTPGAFDPGGERVNG